MAPSYHGSLRNATLTDEVCTETCSASLRTWFDTVVDSCADEDFGDGVPQRFGGYIWAGWNETCIQDPKTKEYCNGKSKLDLIFDHHLSLTILCFDRCYCRFYPVEARRKRTSPRRTLQLLQSPQARHDAIFIILCLQPLLPIKARGGLQEMQRLWPN